jgi:hypothetical protein
MNNRKLQYDLKILLHHPRILDHKLLIDKLTVQNYQATHSGILYQTLLRPIMEIDELQII